MYTSDWHIHSEASYDANLTLPTLLESAKANGITEFGITDHANWNTKSFYENMEESARLYRQYKQPGFYLGVELTPISVHEYEYAAKHGTLEGYTPPNTDRPHDIALMLTLEEMRAFGMQFSVAAAHWPLNVPFEQEKIIREWHRQQMFLVCDPRVDVLAHPWWFYGAKEWQNEAGLYHDKPWFGDFNVVPRSMHDELAAAMLQHGVAVEANAYMLYGENYPERFYHQYIYFLRSLFERGVPVCFGSDFHGPDYPDVCAQVEAAMKPHGFKPGDFSKPRMHEE